MHFLQKPAGINTYFFFHDFTTFLVLFSIQCASAIRYFFVLELRLPYYTNIKQYINLKLGFSSLIYLGLIHFTETHRKTSNFDVFYILSPPVTLVSYKRLQIIKKKLALF